MSTILVVDDEPAARYALRRALESRYRIAEADSAAAARSTLTTESPDLLILDVVLPGEDGVSFLKWLRQEGHDQPVLMVSALDTARAAVDALQLGAADFDDPKSMLVAAIGTPRIPGHDSARIARRAAATRDHGPRKS